MTGPDEHVCTPACDAFYDDMEGGLHGAYVRPRVRAVRTAFAAGLVLGLILAALAAVAVAVIR